MNLLEHSKEAYSDELERRNELRRAIGLPVGLCVIFSGALFSLFRAFPWHEVPVFYSGMFVLIWVIGVLGLAGAIAYLISCHVGYDYAYMATPKEVREYRKNLIEYYNCSFNDKKLDDEIEEFLEKEYAENAHYNSQQNDKKSARLHRASQYLVVTLGVIALSGFFHLMVQVIRWCYEQ